jgi:hypothetical protein
VELIVYDGWPVALAGADEGISTRRCWSWPSSRRVRRWCASLARWRCTPSRWRPGLEHGPFDQGRAERFARALLMPAEEFLAVGDQSDAELARRFGVPIEQIPIRRRELGSRVNGVDSCP